jgi:hypothetical protein
MCLYVFVCFCKYVHLRVSFCLSVSAQRFALSTTKYQGLGDVRSSTMERLQREYGNESMTQATCQPLEVLGWYSFVGIDQLNHVDP